MNPTAIEQAENRFAKAEAAVTRLHKAATHGDMESAWSDFLTAASTIYSKLEQGAKANGKSDAWFGRRKKERKDDPLLSYIHHARNSDEHGIDPISARWDKYDLAEPFDGIVAVAVPNGGLIEGPFVESPTGEKVTLATTKVDSVLLVAVTDSRYGDAFEPPEEHLSVLLPKPITPQSVAPVALEYLRRMIDDAKTLPR